jgi:hypothetical protein
MQIFGGVSFAGDHPIQLMYQAVSRSAAITKQPTSIARGWPQVVG